MAKKREIGKWKKREGKKRRDEGAEAGKREDERRAEDPTQQDVRTRAPIVGSRELMIIK